MSLGYKLSALFSSQPPNVSPPCRAAGPRQFVGSRLTLEAGHRKCPGRPLPAARGKDSGRDRSGPASLEDVVQVAQRRSGPCPAASVRNLSAPGMARPAAPRPASATAFRRLSGPPAGRAARGCPFGLRRLHIGGLGNFHRLPAGSFGGLEIRPADGVSPEAAASASAAWRSSWAVSGLGAGLRSAASPAASKSGLSGRSRGRRAAPAAAGAAGRAGPGVPGAHGRPKRGVHFAATVPDREPAEHEDGGHGAEQRDDGQPHRTDPKIRKTPDTIPVTSASRPASARVSRP